eukprot:1115515-Prymnesium_polylepis.8
MMSAMGLDRVSAFSRSRTERSSVKKCASRRNMHASARSTVSSGFWSLRRPSTTTEKGAKPLPMSAAATCSQKAIPSDAPSASVEPTSRWIRMRMRRGPAAKWRPS